MHGWVQHINALFSAATYIMQQLYHYPQHLALSRGELFSYLQVIPIKPKWCNLSCPLSQLTFQLWTCFPCLLQLLDLTFSFLYITPCICFLEKSLHSQPPYTSTHNLLILPSYLICKTQRFILFFHEISIWT